MNIIMDTTPPVDRKYIVLAIFGPKGLSCWTPIGQIGFCNPPESITLTLSGTMTKGVGQQVETCSKPALLRQTANMVAF